MTENQEDAPRVFAPLNRFQVRLFKFLTHLIHLYLPLDQLREGDHREQPPSEGCPHHSGPHLPETSQVLPQEKEEKLQGCIEEVPPPQAGHEDAQLRASHRRRSLPPHG